MNSERENLVLLLSHIIECYVPWEHAQRVRARELLKEFRESAQPSRTAQPDMAEQLAEALKEIIICVWSDNFKDSDAKLDAIDERAEHALSSECSDDKA